MWGRWLDPECLCENVLLTWRLLGNAQEPVDRYLVPRRLEEGQESCTAGVGVESTILVMTLQGLFFEDYATPAKRMGLPTGLHTGLTS